MLEFIHPADCPVIAELKAHEIVYGRNQSEYCPLRAIRSNTIEKAAFSRWTLTPQQRAEIAAGADIYLEMYTFGQPLQPVRLAIGMDVDPDYIREQYALP